MENAINGLKTIRNAHKRSFQERLTVGNVHAVHDYRSETFVKSRSRSKVGRTPVFI